MSQPPIAPANLEHPQRLSGGTLILFVASALFASFAWLGIWFQMMFFVPRVAATFNEFKMKMPYLTELLMDQLWWIFPAALVVAILIGFAVRKRWAWAFLMIVLPLWLNIIVLVCLFLPTMQLLIGLVEQLAPKQ